MIVLAMHLKETRGLMSCTYLKPLAANLLIFGLVIVYPSAHIHSNQGRL